MATVPDHVKRTVDDKAQALIESHLRPQYVVPPPPDPQFNYVVDIQTKWRGAYFYFIAIYRNPRSDARSPSFEHRFARMEYRGRDTFSLAFMRHTGKWVALYTGMTLGECLSSIRDDPFFQP